MERLTVGFAKLRHLVERFAADQEGSAAIEYILLASGIGVVSVAVMEPVRQTVIEKWSAIAAALSAQ
jgi:Flp pilus assembly pilin Flp